TLLDNASLNGYYGAFTVNAHMDLQSSTVADAVIDSARARGVPVISALQMLKWLDGRNGSSFGSLSRNGNILSFTITAGPNTTGLQAMLPTSGPIAPLTALALNGAPVSYTTQTI